MAFRAVLFDWGDTLFYSPSGVAILVSAGVAPPLAERVWQEIWQASKTAPELARHRDVSVAAHRAAWIPLFQRAERYAPGIAEVLYERVLQPTGWTPYPDALPVLRQLHARGTKVGVVSNVPAPLRPVFQRHGLDAYVQGYTESYRHGREKPDPELFRIACRQLDVPPAAALMVGDSPLTDGGAVEAGLTTLLLPSVAPGEPRRLERVLALLPS